MTVLNATLYDDFGAPLDLTAVSAETIAHILREKVGDGHQVEYDEAAGTITVTQRPLSEPVFQREYLGEWVPEEQPREHTELTIQLPDLGAVFDEMVCSILDEPDEPVQIRQSVFDEMMAATQPNYLFLTLPAL